MWRTKSLRRWLRPVHMLMHSLVLIYVGVMKITGDFLQPVRGKSLPLDIQHQWSSDQLLAAVKKLKDFNQDLFYCTLMLRKSETSQEPTPLSQCRNTRRPTKE